MLAADFESADLDRRFGGLGRLYGSAGAKRIRAAHMVVVGLGGVGSWAAEAAARSGIGRLTLIDLDHIAESNINRQVHALSSTLGQAKVHSMRERIGQINPDCRVDCIEDFVAAGNWPAILSLDSGFDRHQLAVIDACDQVSAKTAMAAWAIKNEVASISVGAAGGKRLAHRVDIADLSTVTHDPLLAQMRYKLRREHGASRQGKIGLACVFSLEPVHRPVAEDALDMQQGGAQSKLQTQVQLPAQTDGSLNCHGYGSVVTVTATFGMCAAEWVLNKIAG